MPPQIETATANPIIPPVRIVDRADDLSLIRHDGIGGVILQRPLPEEFQEWVEGLAPLNLPSVRAILPPQETHALVTEVCDTANMPNGPNRDWFIGDVCFLANTFVKIMSAPFLQLRLDVVADNACHKFHVDMVRARLICTYRGRGTQYGVLQDGTAPHQICDVPTGDPILLRGNYWPNREPNGLRHRSPPIAGTGETRLVLVLDIVENPEDPYTVQISEPKHRIGSSQPGTSGNATRYHV